MANDDDDLESFDEGEVEQHYYDPFTEEEISKEEFDRLEEEWQEADSYEDYLAEYEDDFNSFDEEEYLG